METNTELQHKAMRLKIPLRYIGSKDVIKIPSVQGAYIINMQDDRDSNGNYNFGSHWVCFYIEKGKAVYFDSFGLMPPADVQLFLKNVRPMIISSKQIQNLKSGHCGSYCLSFLHYMSHHKKMPLRTRLYNFLNMWNDDVTKNLSILKKYLKSIE